MWFKRRKHYWRRTKKIKGIKKLLKEGTDYTFISKITDKQLMIAKEIFINKNKCLF